MNNKEMEYLKFSLIISTLGERSFEFDRLLESLECQTYKNFEIVVVSQGNHNDLAGVLEKTSLDYIHLKTDIRGLSRARNIGLGHVSGDLVTISDDDCWYPVDCLEKVANYFFEYKEANVLCFKIFDPISCAPYKSYSDDIRNLRIKDIGSRSSIEIFYRNTTNNKKQRFDERFGLGANYPSGEENIFLSDLLSIGNRIVYIPEFIVYHKQKERQNVVFTPIKMETAYFMFKRIFGSGLGRLIYSLFLIRHFFKVENKIQALLLNGRKNMR